MLVSIFRLFSFTFLCIIISPFPITIFYLSFLIWFFPFWSGYTFLEWVEMSSPLVSFMFIVLQYESELYAAIVCPTFVRINNRMLGFFFNTSFMFPPVWLLYKRLYLTISSFCRYFSNASVTTLSCYSLLNIVELSHILRVLCFD
jgi:hypothetical protein